jgi:hypothetical protein
MKRSVAILAFAMVGMSGCSTPADDVGNIQETFALTSEDFADGAELPDWVTADALGGQCTGDNINPQLAWDTAPESARAFALTVTDTDAGSFAHWLLADIPAAVTSVDRGASGQLEGVGGKSSLSAAYDGRYFGPCPPGPDHHYVFTVYALNAPLDLEPGFTLGDLRDSLGGHVLAVGSLTGVRSGPAQ